MKVCMFVLNNCKYDTRVLKEARTLTEAGHDVRIIAVLDEDTEPYEEKDGFRIIRVTRKRIRYRVLQAILGRKVLAALAVFNRPLVFGEYCYRSWKVVKHEPADVYHSHDLTTLPVGYMAKRRANGKLVYDSHELFTELHYVPRIERPIFRFVERRLVQRADAVITVNEFAAGELSERYGIGLPGVVMNCPPLAKQSGEQYNSSIRESLGLGDAVPIIVHVGLFSKSRGSEKLVSAVPFLNHGVIVFLGWGAGAEEIELKELVRQKGLEDKVLFVPPVAPEEVVGYISSAQAGVVLFRNVSLNHYYATPNKLWECMNAGLPVVSSNFPALKAIVEGYRLGKTCDPEDPKDIAAAINWVLADKKRYEKMRRNALKAAKIFNWENESRKLLEVYRRLSKHADDRTA
jgi:glycosyltransferase involved in cell wall biosynthesis